MSLLEENKTAPVSGEDLPEPRRLEGLSDAAFSIIITLRFRPVKQAVFAALSNRMTRLRIRKQGSECAR